MGAGKKPPWSCGARKKPGPPWSGEWQSVGAPQLALFRRQWGRADACEWHAGDAFTMGHVACGAAPWRRPAYRASTVGVSIDDGDRFHDDCQETQQTTHASAVRSQHVAACPPHQPTRANRSLNHYLRVREGGEGGEGGGEAHLERSSRRATRPGSRGPPPEGSSAGWEMGG